MAGDNGSEECGPAGAHKQKCRFGSRRGNEGARFGQQREAAVGTVVQGADEEAALRLRHAVLAPLHLRQKGVTAMSCC